MYPRIPRKIGKLASVPLYKASSSTVNNLYKITTTTASSHILLHYNFKHSKPNPTKQIKNPSRKLNSQTNSPKKTQEKSNLGVSSAPQTMKNFQLGSSVFCEEKEKQKNELLGISDLLGEGLVVEGEESYEGDEYCNSYKWGSC